MEDTRTRMAKPELLDEDNEIMFPEWDDLTLTSDETVPVDERISRAIHKNHEMNTVIKVKRSLIKGIRLEYSWGAFAEQNLDDRLVIVEYKGKIGSTNGGGRYVFENGDGTFTDGENPLEAGVARFINSTGPGEEADANVEVRSRNGKLYIDTIKYIHKGQELLFDYGEKYRWDEGEQKSTYTRLFPRKKKNPCTACDPVSHHFTKCYTPPMMCCSQKNKLYNLRDIPNRYDYKN
jgi:hypothetical protein